MLEREISREEVTAVAKKKEPRAPARGATKEPRTLVTIDNPDDMPFEGKKLGKVKEAGRERAKRDKK